MCIRDRNKITANTRDLYRRPLIADDFSNVDAVILNPPRSGAGTQINHLAASNAPVVVYVSCNPSSFAQDAAKLIGFGYILEELVPVDHFCGHPMLNWSLFLKELIPNRIARDDEVDGLLKYKPSSLHPQVPHECRHKDHADLLLAFLSLDRL